MIEKLYLVRNDRQHRQLVHGVDYDKGTQPGSCGIRHEFFTRNCRPVVFNEDQVESYRRSGREVVELVSLDREETNDDRAKSAD